jgi:Co/Zn/Cd efflux system component
MGEQCCSTPPPQRDSRYLRILWIALAANAGMFVIELAASIHSGSTALAADAVDFLGDAGNYGLSLAAIAAGGAWTTHVALGKGIAMMSYGAGVLAFGAWRALAGLPPEPLTMGVVASAALGVNLCVTALLFRFREGDANMRSVWLCSRNDALANLAVLAAAAGVLGTASVWPDIAVATILAALGLSSGRLVITRARGELALREAAIRLTPGIR